MAGDVPADSLGAAAVLKKMEPNKLNLMLLEAASGSISMEPVRNGGRLARERHQSVVGPARGDAGLARARALSADTLRLGGGKVAPPGKRFEARLDPREPLGPQGVSKESFGSPRGILERPASRGGTHEKDTMDKNNDMRMDEAELASWRSLRGVAGSARMGSLGLGGAPAAAPKKMTPNKLNLMLLDAAGRGDVEMARQALAEGAMPNARLRASPGDTPFALAIEAGHDALAVELLRAGSWPAPSRWSRPASKAFDEAAAAGSFDSAARAGMAIQAMRMLASHAKDFGVFRLARDWCDPAKTDSDLVGMAMEQDSYDLAMRGLRMGVPMTSKAWRLAEERMRWRYAGIKDHPRRKEVLEMLAHPGAIATITGAMCESLYRCVVLGDDAELAVALLDGGLRPNKEWSVSIKPPRHKPSEEPKIPMVALAAAMERPELFEFFKGCPPAMAAAKRSAPSPEKLRDVPIGRLMELREAGVDIEGIDEKGRSLPHLWAQQDRDPRGGWATLSKKVPRLFDMKDEAGMTGADLMAAKLLGAQKDEFLASLSRIESREISRELGPKNNKAAAPARQRL